MTLTKKRKKKNDVRRSSTLTDFPIYEQQND